jgi:hypothetical protein
MSAADEQDKLVPMMTAKASQFREKARIAEQQAAELEAMAAKISATYMEEKDGPNPPRKRTPVPMTSQTYAGYEKGEALFIYMRARPKDEFIPVKEIVEELNRGGADVGEQKKGESDIIRVATANRKRFIYDEEKRVIALNLSSCYKTPMTKEDKRLVLHKARGS